MKKFFITTLCIISVIIILTNPLVITNGVISGIKLSLYSVIPALLPFMIISNIMLENDCCQYISILFYPILSKIFNVSKNGCFAIIMGYTCGFPMGAKTIGDLFTQGKISHVEASYLITFCNNTSITFLLNYIGYNCLKESISSKKLIFFVYFPPLMVGILNGLILKYISFKQNKKLLTTKKIKAKNESDNTYTMNGINSSNTISKKTSLYSNDIISNNSQAFYNNTNAQKKQNPLYTSLKSISLLSAYVVFFSIISNYIASIDIFPTYTKIFLMCITEITSGINYICTGLQITSHSLLLILISTIFGGFSITMQSFSFIPTKKMKFCYILGKIQAVVICIVIFFIYRNFYI